MRKPVILITGAGGEVGRGLLEHFGSSGQHSIIALDLTPLEPEYQAYCTASIVGDILDENLLQRLVSEYEIHEIYHLAALLSTRAEYTPARAHRVNVEGTLSLLNLAHEQSRWHGNTVKFIFPSSIAAYGIPTREVKDSLGKVSENEHNFPITMYGCNKLYCENLGRYFALHYRQLASGRQPSGVDFRALRFPGLISAKTTPSGGTSDYAPEMLFAAAKAEAYACFVDEKACIPFMAMPDAISALIQLAGAPVAKLSRRVYNVMAFSLSAEQIRDRVAQGFSGAKITFKRDEPRARIVDSWPADVDDQAARSDWQWRPKFDADSAFSEYLIPGVKAFLNN